MDENNKQDMSQQYTQSDADVQDDWDKPENEWKVAIGIGIVGVVLSILFGTFRIRVISSWLILLLLAGDYFSIKGIMGGIKSRKFKSLLMGIIALVINLAATAYYGWSLIYTVMSKFN